MNDVNLIRQKLIQAICVLASVLEFDVKLTKRCVYNLSKDELIDKFTELKELRLKKENARIIELLLG